MEISPILLAKLLFYSFLLGIAIGVFYDANRIVRVFLGAMDVRGTDRKEFCLKLPFIDRYVSSVNEKNAKGIVKNVILFAGDFLTVLAGSIGLLVLNYGYNSGRFRFFTVIGIFVGFLLYYFTLGKLTLGVIAPLAFFLKYLFFAFFVVLWSPFKFLTKIVIKNVRKIYFLCQFALEKKRKKEYNIYEKVWLLEMSKNGFIDDSFMHKE